MSSGVTASTLGDRIQIQWAQGERAVRVGNIDREVSMGRGSGTPYKGQLIVRCQVGIEGGQQLRPETAEEPRVRGDSFGRVAPWVATHNPHH